MVRGDMSASCRPKRCHDERQQKHICVLAPITGIGEQDLRTRSPQARSRKTHYFTAASIPAPLSPSAGPCALEEREYHGFVDGLIRNSVGLEDYEDRRADFISALDQIRESEAYFRRRSAAA